MIRQVRKLSGKYSRHIVTDLPIGSHLCTKQAHRKDLLCQKKGIMPLPNSSLCKPSLRTYPIIKLDVTRPAFLHAQSHVAQPASGGYALETIQTTAVVHLSYLQLPSIT